MTTYDDTEIFGSLVYQDPDKYKIQPIEKEYNPGRINTTDLLPNEADILTIHAVTGELFIHVSHYHYWSLNFVGH